MSETFVNAKALKIMQIFKQTFDIENLNAFLKMIERIFLARLVDCFTVHI